MPRAIRNTTNGKAFRDENCRAFRSVLPCAGSVVDDFSVPLFIMLKFVGKKPFSHLQQDITGVIWRAFKRIIEGGFGGDAKKTVLNPSEARLGRRAENELEGTQITKYMFLQMA